MPFVFYGHEKRHDAPYYIILSIEMYKILRKLSPFALYWHCVLDVFLTHIVAIAFLNMRHPMAAAIMMSLDATFKIILSVPVSRLTIRIPFQTRGNLSAGLKFILIMVWFTVISQISLYSISLVAVVFCLIFKLLVLLDSMLSVEFIFALSELFSISAPQSVAMQNILVRASTAIAPAVGLMILSMRHTKWIILLPMILLGALSVVFLRKILCLGYTGSPSQHSTQSLSLKKLFNHGLMRWGLIYQIVGNLAFAGVALLFLAQLNVHGSAFFNEITVLYSAFLMAQCIVLFFGERAIPAANTVHVSFILGICGVLVIVAGLCHPGIIRLGTSGLIGITYSFSLSAVQKVIITPLRGARFLGYMGWAQMAGRSSALVSTTILGMLIGIGALPSILLIVCGLLGTISASSLLLFSTKIYVISDHDWKSEKSVAR